MAPRATRSRPLAEPLSPEVTWYLESRGYPLPRVVPRVRTPEPHAGRGGIRGVFFDAAEVDAKINALKHLRHTKGKWVGRPIVPSAAQVAYIIAPIFGWRIEVSDWIRGDEEVTEPKHRAAAMRRAKWTEVPESTRRVRVIREAYIEMPRKGAKTTLVSALAMLLAFADGEGGAEVLLGAASRDQAGVAFKPLAAVAKSSPVLADAGVRALRNEIRQDSSQSFVKTVSSRGDLAHGANVHGGLVDELHVHKSPDLLEAIESGTGAREQPLVMIITTADDGQTTTVYAQRRDMVEKVAKKILKVPSMYGVVFAADDKDDPFAEETWEKANPLYPVTPSPAFMRAAADKAKANPAQLASFMRLHLGVRAKQDAVFFDLQKWDRNKVVSLDENALKGRMAVGGLDLGSVSDLTALAWLFPDERGVEFGYDTIMRFWLPEGAVTPLNASTHGMAQVWIDEGWIKVTPGDVTDYEYIRKQIRKDMGKFDVWGIGFDRWNSTQLIIDLIEKDDAPMERVSQTVMSLSAPLKELDRLVRKGTARNPMLRHRGDPVLRWMADNMRPYVDPNGNVKPDKRRSMDKIDGISALTNAMFVALATDFRTSSADDFVVV